MKKYILIAFIIIFGTSILSAYMTYKSTNSLESNTKSANEQISFEKSNSDKTETIVTSEEVAVAEDVEKVVEEKEEIVQEKHSTNETKNIEEPKKTEELRVKTETKEQPKKVEENTVKVQETENVETKVIEKKEKQTTTESYTEVKVEIAEKKECEGNNHGMSVGNTGMWFNTKDEAISTYKAEIKKWGDLWTDKENPISNEEYYKNCPYGYEIWSCPYCGKWTLNYYLDN